MKFTHYTYKCRYLLDSDVEQNKYTRRDITANHRYQIDVDCKYHTTYITVASEDPDFASLDLGVDFSAPGIKFKRKMERLFLNFVIKGKGSINGQPFSAGQFYYTLPSEKHTVQSDANDPFISVWISMRGDYIHEIAKELESKSAQRILRLERSTDVMSITKTLLYDTNLGETSTSYLRFLIGMYLSYVGAQNEDEQHSDVYATDKMARLVKESKKYVRNNLRTVTVADMAAAQHYNVKYFSRTFSAAMGMTPSEYITDFRLHWAEGALVNSDLSINEIMEAIGYDHRNGFNAAFKKKYGHPPAEYRRMKKTEKKAK